MYVRMSDNFHATLLTLFPEMFPGTLGFSLAGAALKRGVWGYDTVNIRDFGLTKHRNVDEAPAGGGNGLIMRPDVLGATLDHALEKRPGAKIYYPTPRGERLNQRLVHEISQEKSIIILCGRFEGIDERVIEEYNPVLINVGDYVLSGGELAAMVMLDAALRLVPGVLENRDTLLEESFEQTHEGKLLLEHPLYTKPNEWRGRKIPDTLLSGNHKALAEWKRGQSIAITKRHRPDLFDDKQ